MCDLVGMHSALQEPRRERTAPRGSSRVSVGSSPATMEGRWVRAAGVGENEAAFFGPLYLPWALVQSAMAVNPHVRYLPQCLMKRTQRVHIVNRREGGVGRKQQTRLSTNTAVRLGKKGIQSTVPSHLNSTGHIRDAHIHMGDCLCREEFGRNFGNPIPSGGLYVKRIGMLRRS